MLYLDKCWNELQALLTSAEGEADRPALQLVDGIVTVTCEGWIPVERALSPEEVKAVADDLATVAESDVRRIASQFQRSNESEQMEYDYITQFLAAAQGFTASLANDGRGLVYRIG